MLVDGLDSSTYADAQYILNNFMQPVAKTILGSATASITFSNIPQTFSSLMLLINGRTSTSSGSDFEDIALQYNGVTTSTYNSRFLYINTTSTPAGTTFGGTSATCGHMWTSVLSTAGAGRTTVFIPNYTSTTWLKGHNFHAFVGDGSTNCQAGTGGGANNGITAPVTSLTIIVQSGANFLTNTYAELYGVS